MFFRHIHNKYYCMACKNIDVYLRKLYKNYLALTLIR